MKIPKHFYRWKRSQKDEHIPNDFISCGQGWWLQTIATDADPDEYDVDSVPERTYHNNTKLLGEGLPNLLTHAMIGDYTAIKGLCILVKRNPAKFGEYQATAEALVEAYESKRVKK